jgi:hypothetical protein
MVKEEGRGLSKETATKKREKPQRALQAHVFERSKSVISIRFVFVLRLFVAISSVLRHSLFDIHPFVLALSPNSCRENKLSRTCRTKSTRGTGSDKFGF